MDRAEGASMTAAVFTAPGMWEWQHVTLSEPRPGEVLVRVEYAGICGTDLALFDGSMGYYAAGLTTFPLRPGHEWCGMVTAVGHGVDPAWVGTRVVGEPFLSCGRCALCRNGRRDQCAAREETGVRGSAPGALAEYIAVPLENTTAVPTGADPASAVLAEPLVTVLHALDETGMRAGESVGVVGAGTLGLLAAQVAVAAGCEVIIYARGDRADRAGDCGASFRRVTDAEPDRHDLVIEASGGADASALAIRLARPGGRIGLVGVPPGPASIDLTDVVVKGLRVHGVLGGIPYLRRAVDLIARGVIDASAIIDRVVPASDLADALELLARGGLRRPKVLLDMSALPFAGERKEDNE